MDLIAWLEDMASAYRIEPSELTTRRYLKSLERWRLAPEQWEQLSDRAVLRFTRFPSIEELYDIAGELQREAEIRANSEHLAKMLDYWKQRQTGESASDSICSELRGPA